MIIIADQIPDIYNTSHDFKVFEAILAVLFNQIDIRTQRSKYAHSPDRCFDEDLGSLASLFNLPAVDRTLLKYYGLMTKNKGTKEAAKAMAEFCGMSSIKLTTNGNEITIEANIGNFNSKLFNIMKRRLLPFNCVVKIKPK